MENNEVKVSVIMLAYNIGRYVETAIIGVLKQQTKYRVQLVIGEDCSTDNTLEICQRYAEQYPEAITLVHHNPNYGLQRNTMDCYKYCKGQYIAICDGDDYWTDKHKLQKMTDFMDSHTDFSECFHRVINYYEGKGIKSLSNGKGFNKVVSDVVDLSKSCYITNSSCLFRKYYDELPTWLEEISLCDYAIHMLNAERGKIYYFSKPMAVYRKHSAGIFSEMQSDRQLNMTLHVRELLMEHFKDNETVFNNLRKAATNIVFGLIRYYKSHSDNNKEYETYQRILRFYPGLTVDDIKKMEQDDLLNKQHQGKSLKHLFMKIMSMGRAVISFFIPLPRV